MPFTRARFEIQDQDLCGFKNTFSQIKSLLLILQDRYNILYKKKKIQLCHLITHLYFCIHPEDF